MSQDIILASGSASRRALLAGAGVEAISIKPNVDEGSAKAAFRAEGLAVRDQAMRLAEMKAIKVSLTNGGLVVGGDQILALGDNVFDKPRNIDEARSHIEALSGKTHTLETAIVVAENGRIVWRYLARPKLTMRQVSADFIEAYLDECGDGILSTVGGYKLEGRGAQLFSAIEGDYFSILGLPLLPLLDYFRERGVLTS